MKTWPGKEAGVVLSGKRLFPDFRFEHVTFRAKVSKISTVQLQIQSGFICIIMKCQETRPARVFLLYC